MVTFAVKLRNRRRWVRASEFATRVQSYAGVDTFRISCWVQFKTVEGFRCPHQEFIALLRAQQEQLRRGGKAGAAVVDVFGELVSVNRSGTTKGEGDKRGPYYPFVVTWRGIRFEFQQFSEALKTIPNVVVYAGSMPLTAKGGDWEAVWDEARYFLGQVLCGEITQTKVGRLDVFADVVGFTTTYFYDLYRESRYVRRSRNFQPELMPVDVSADVVDAYMQAGRKELAVRLHEKGSICTGMYLGGSGILCRIYDKLRELDDKEDVVKLEAMKAAYWLGEVPAELTRVEFQLATRQLREAGITDVQSLRVELRNLAGWLCNSWLTIRAEGFTRNQAARAGYDPAWRDVVDAIAGRFGREWSRTARVRPLGTDGGALLDQAAGCLSSYMARSGDFPGGPEELHTYSLDLVTLALNRQGLDTAFDRLKGKVLEHGVRQTNAFVELSRGDPHCQMGGGDSRGSVRVPARADGPGGLGDHTGTPVRVGGVYGPVHPMGDLREDWEDFEGTLDDDGKERLKMARIRAELASQTNGSA